MPRKSRYCKKDFAVYSSFSSESDDKKHSRTERSFFSIEADSAPINSLTFISGKYLCTWSDYFEPGIPEKERQWTHSQLWAMLTDSHVALNDPYALAASGGPKTAEQLDEIAKKAVKDKLDALLKEQYGGV